MELEFSIAQKNYSVSVQKKNEYYQVSIGDQVVDVRVEQITPNCLLLIDKNGMQRIYIASIKNKTFIHLDGRPIIVDHAEQKEKTSFQTDEHLAGADQGICAPMPGKILKIFVEENQQVAAKQNLVIVEAMKMEHNIRAPRNGMVKKINFNEGDLVDTGQEILELEFIAKENMNN